MKAKKLIVLMLVAVLLLPTFACGGGEETVEVADSDGDGWTDVQEQNAGTNPYQVDSDGDGYWDPSDPNPLNSSIPGSTSEPTTPPVWSPLPQVMLIEPDNGSTGVGIEVVDIGFHTEVWRVRVYFRWKDWFDSIEVLNETPYSCRLQVDDDLRFTSPNVHVTLCDPNSPLDCYCDNEYISESELKPNTEYFWHVRLEHEDQGYGLWSETWSFRTMRRP